MTRRAWLALAGGLWLLAFVHSVSAGMKTEDESWILRVVDRMAEGDVLYRDVFFGSTPLAPWLALGPVALLGSEMLVLKGVGAAVHTGAALATASAARALGFAPRAAVLIALLCVVVPGLRASSLYNELSIALTLAALAAVLRWEPDSGSRRWLVAAGVCVGLAFATKHNVGAFAVLALAGAIVAIGGWRRAFAAGPSAAAGTLAGATLPLVPVLLTGGGPRLVEYTVTAKGTYTERAGVSLLDSMEEGVAAVLDVVDLSSLEDALLQLGFLALPVAAIGLALAVARAPDPVQRGRLLTVALFCTAVAANLYPRADASHLRVALPALFLALAVVARDVLPAPPRTATAAAAGGLALLLTLATLLAPPLRLARGSAVIADMPHFRGVLLTPGERNRARDSRRRLLAAARRNEPILTLGSSAAYVQLLAELESPTPYDYPLVTALGRDGEARTADAIRAGEIPAACITLSERGIEAARIEAAVRDVLPYRGSLGVCRLYAR